MSIQIDTNFNNANLPSALPYDEQILALPSLTEWFQADPSAVTVVAGSVSDLVSKKASARVFTQGTVGRRGALVPSAIGGFPALALDGLDDNYALTDGPNLALPFGWAVIFRSTDNGANQNVMGRFSSSSSRCILNLSSSGTLAFQIGSSSIGGPVTRDAWHLAILGSDGSNMYMRLDGADIAPVAHNGNVSSNPFYLGTLNPSLSQCFLGRVSDVWLFDQNILGSAATIELIEGFARQVYGLSV